LTGKRGGKDFPTRQGLPQLPVAGGCCGLPMNSLCAQATIQLIEYKQYFSWLLLLA
jgi:hypothetical protein